MDLKTSNPNIPTAGRKKDLADKPFSFRILNVLFIQTAF